MKKINKKELLKIAQLFRKSIENINLDNAPGFLPHFPSGCCSWATLFLGNCLKNEFGLKPKRFCGAMYNGSSHEWIVLDSVIIDITSDQYEDSNKSIIVSEKSKWHEKFNDGKIMDIKTPKDYDSAITKGMKPSQIYILVIEKFRLYYNKKV